MTEYLWSLALDSVPALMRKHKVSKEEAVNMLKVSEQDKKEIKEALELNERKN